MILRVDGVSFAYPSAPVLNDVSFDVEAHEVVAVLGPNGSGKTTLLRCVNRILKPARGSVFVGGRDLSKAAPRQIAREIAYVAQRSEPARITAFDAVLLGRKPYFGFGASADDMARTYEVIALLGLEDLALRTIDQMSGGEYQKVCIARALVQEPTVMLLDEPTSSLDLRNQLEILSLLRRIVTERRMCAVIAIHDLNTAFRFCDSFLFLKDGTIHAGFGRSQIAPEIIEHIYGVRVSVHWHDDRPYVVPDEQYEGVTNG
jgi:iron complex transport system ATP-binding protein